MNERNKLLELCNLLMDAEITIEKIAVVHDDTYNELFETDKPDTLAFEIGYERCNLRGSIIYDLVGKAKKICARMDELIQAARAEEKEKAAAPVEGKATASDNPETRTVYFNYTHSDEKRQDFSTFDASLIRDKIIVDLTAAKKTYTERGMTDTYQHQLVLISGKAIMAHELGHINRHELGVLTLMISESETKEETEQC